ncbi:hypothetical protein ACIQWN_38210 [Streptomyces vinaceus]|uniref:hypothetical protein n=1 Tax=Streptomyces vinaceus TaxID=1960 RepID=UPI00380C59F7
MKRTALAVGSALLALIAAAGTSHAANNSGGTDTPSKPAAAAGTPHAANNPGEADTPSKPAHVKPDWNFWLDTPHKDGWDVKFTNNSPYVITLFSIPGSNMTKPTFSERITVHTGEMVDLKGIPSTVMNGPANADFKIKYPNDKEDLAGVYLTASADGDMSWSHVNQAKHIISVVMTKDPRHAIYVTAWPKFR